MDISIEKSTQSYHIVANGGCWYIMTQLLIIDRNLCLFQIIRNFLLFWDKFWLFLQNLKNEVLMLSDHYEVVIVQKLYRHDWMLRFKDWFIKEFFLYFWLWLLVNVTSLNENAVACIWKQLFLPCCFVLNPDWMWVVANDLWWILAKVSNLCLKWHSFIGILNGVEIDRVLISERKENVHVFNSSLSSLFVSED